MNVKQVESIKCNERNDTTFLAWISKVVKDVLFPKALAF